MRGGYRVGNGCEWTARDEWNLAEGWLAGLSAAAIGLNIGRSRNAVIGKAHRLGLIARSSPIRREPQKPSGLAADRGRR